MLEVWVPAGTLAMGSTLSDVDDCVAAWAHRLLDTAYVPNFRSWIMKEHPRHLVEIGGFAAAKYPVTNGEFSRFLDATAGRRPESITTAQPADHPVWGVTRVEAKAYAEWHGERTGRAWRLPTEAEWEWMAAGPEGRRYPYGTEFDPSRANTIEAGPGRTTPVETHEDAASWCGAVDLAGNVEEWTSSRYAPYPGGVYVEDELTLLVGRDYPILRGGCFALGGDLTRSARRHGPHPGPRFRHTGFRLVASPRPEAAT